MKASAFVRACCAVGLTRARYWFGKLQMVMVVQSSENCTILHEEAFTAGVRSCRGVWIRIRERSAESKLRRMDLCLKCMMNEQG